MQTGEIENAAAQSEEFVFGLGALVRRVVGRGAGCPDGGLRNSLPDSCGAELDEVGL